MSQDLSFLNSVASTDSPAADHPKLQGGLEASVTMMSGATEPTTTFAYMLWADTTANKVKQRNAADNGWIEIGDLGVANWGIAGPALHADGQLAPHANLRVSRNEGGVPADEILITADEVILTDTDDNQVRLTNVSEVIDLDILGANGRDTGGRITTGWWDVYVIYDGTTVSALAVRENNAPTMPSGYTYRGLVSVCYDSSGLREFYQRDRSVVAETVEVLSNGTASNWTNIDCSSAVPNRAAWCGGIMDAASTSAGSTGRADIRAAPSGLVGNIEHAVRNQSTASEQTPYIVYFAHVNQTLQYEAASNSRLFLQISMWGF